MRHLLISFVVSASFVLLPSLEAQENSEKEKAAPPLVGTWLSKSEVGSTIVRYRKDGWFISVHYFATPNTLTRNSIWAVGHWALSKDSVVLHRLAGSEGLELVPSKRQLAI